MSTWREKAKKLLDSPSSELTELTKAPFVSFGSESLANIPDFFGLSAAANDPPAEGYGTGCDAFGYPLRPLVRCRDCIHFTRNRDNPVIGIGTCQLGEPDLGGWPYFPGCARCCDSFEAINNPTGGTNA